MLDLIARADVFAPQGGSPAVSTRGHGRPRCRNGDGRRHLRRARSPGRNPAINSYRDRDGRWFWLMGLEGDRRWPVLARVVGHPEWVEDPRFATQADRRKHAAELVGMLDAIFDTWPLEEWGEVFDQEDPVS